MYCDDFWDDQGGQEGSSRSLQLDYPRASSIMLEQTPVRQDRSRMPRPR